MVKIGIYARKNTPEITEALILLLKNSNSRIALKTNFTRCEYSNGQDDGIDYLIVSLDSAKKCPPLDIIIFDCPGSCAVRLCKILSGANNSNAILIYNSDRGTIPEFQSFNCVDYGFSKGSAVSVSSVGNEYGNEKTFTVSVQEGFKCLSGATYPISEVMVDCCSDIKLENRLPAVICGLIIGNSEKNQIII